MYKWGSLNQEWCFDQYLYAVYSPLSSLKLSLMTVCWLGWTFMIHISSPM